MLNMTDILISCHIYTQSTILSIRSTEIYTSKNSLHAPQVIGNSHSLEIHSDDCGRTRVTTNNCFNLTQPPQKGSAQLVYKSDNRAALTSHAFSHYPPLNERSDIVASVALETPFAIRNWFRKATSITANSVPRDRVPAILSPHPPSNTVPRNNSCQWQLFVVYSGVRGRFYPRLVAIISTLVSRCVRN